MTESDSNPTPPTPVTPKPAPNAAPPKKGGIVGQVIMVVVVLVLSAIGFWWWAQHEKNAKPAAQQVMSYPPQEVNTITVAKSTAPIVLDYLGQTVFSQRVDIRARVKGFLESRTFEEGGMVKKGQVLFTIEKDTFIATLNAAKAQLAQAQAHHQKAQRDVIRFTELVGQKAASPNELDDKKTSLAVYAADIQAAKAQIQQAQLNLDYTVIRSPITGVISQTLQDVGNFVDDGSTNNLLAVVGQENPIYVRFPVNEQDLLHWHDLSLSTAAGQTKSTLSVEAELSSGEVYPLRGKINFVDTKVDPATGTAMVRAVFDNPKHVLKPGQFIRVKILGLLQKNVLAVPQKAVIQSPTGATVYVVDDKNKAQMRPVILGNWVGNNWIINKGLVVGDHVIINRLVQLRPGADVKPTNIPIGEASASASAIDAAGKAKTSSAKPNPSAQ